MIVERIKSIVDIPFILNVRLSLWTHQPGSDRQEEDHTGFLHLPSPVLALIFIARTIQPFLSLVGREVEFYVIPTD